MPEYVAFLRGINVGGHKPIPMDALKRAFTAIGLTNVRTLLASGNVLFEAPRAVASVLEQRISGKLKKAFGHDIPVFIRTRKELERLDAAQPFKGIPMTARTCLYVTLLSKKPTKKPPPPNKSPDGGHTILQTRGREIFSIVTPAPNGRTVDLMADLEKIFGAQITTRNWQTIVRVLKAFKL